MTVAVTSAVAGSYLNSTGPVTSTNAGTGTAATATLTVASFAPGNFNAFETSTTAGATTGVIKTKIAGSAFSLDVVVIASGAQQTGFTDSMIVELLGNNTLSVSLDASNCPTSSTLVQTISPNPTITGGRSTVSFAAVANSWRDVRVRVRWPTSSPTVTRCSTDNFAIRPNTLASYSVTDTDWQTAGTVRTLNTVAVPGGVTHKAGRPFTVRATAVNAAGTPATTTNYTGTPTGTLTACAGAACTATFGTFTLGASFAAGVLTSNSATYGDVGSFALRLVDSTFSNVDASDGSTTTERNITSAAINTGRFVPNHFAVALNAPAFGTACSGGGFTYIGQTFNYTVQPVITVTAQDFANSTATLYAGALWQITNASLTGKSYTAASGTLDPSGITGTDPVIAVAGSGMGTLTFDSGTGLLFTRATPVAPFDADISLALNVIDADGVAFAGNPASFGTATAGNGIAFSSGKPMRFGRLRLVHSYGSELFALDVPLRVEYLETLSSGTGFVAALDDTCTTGAAIATGHVTLDPSALVNPAATVSITPQAIISGSGSIRLGAPSPTTTGRIGVTLNLLPSYSWLQVDNNGDGSFIENPDASASFGLYGGDPRRVYTREQIR